MGKACEVVNLVVGTTFTSCNLTFLRPTQPCQVRRADKKLLHCNIRMAPFTILEGVLESRYVYPIMKIQGRNLLISP
jgi:hypothetical protein